MKARRFLKGMRCLASRVAALADEQRRPITEAVAGIREYLNRRPNARALSKSEGLITASCAGVDFLLAGNIDDVIERRIAYDGVWETNILEPILKLVTPGSLFIDVGANIGAISIPVAKKGLPAGVTVISVEANASVAALLRTNVAINRLPNVSVVEKAASDKCGTATFYQTRSDATNHGLSSLMPHPQSGERVEIEVETIRIDDIVEIYGQGLPVSVLKVDVEGAEPLVLSGARRTLEEFRPFLFFESLKEHSMRNLEALSRLAELLTRYGYDCYSLSDKKHHFLAEIDLGAGFSGDVLAVSSTKPNLVTREHEIQKQASSP